MIKSFEGWYKVTQPRLKEKGLVSAMKFNKNVKAELVSAVLEFEGSKHLGVFIVWEFGCCDVHAYLVESDEVILMERADVGNEQELLKFLNDKVDIVLSW